jgi:hypothetical protein
MGRLDVPLEMQMSALVTRAAQQSVGEKEIFEAKSGAKTEVKSESWFEPRLDDVFIHIRFHPNADIAALGIEAPAHINPMDLYKLLRVEAADYYRGLAGGRGFFRIPRTVYDAIVSKL